MAPRRPRCPAPCDPALSTASWPTSSRRPRASSPPGWLPVQVKVPSPKKTLEYSEDHREAGGGRYPCGAGRRQPEDRLQDPCRTAGGPRAYMLRYWAPRRPRQATSPCGDPRARDHREMSLEDSSPRSPPRSAPAACVAGRGVPETPTGVWGTFFSKKPPSRSGASTYQT